MTTTKNKSDLQTLRGDAVKPVTEITVSAHAVMRYRERVGSTKSDQNCINRILAIVTHGEEWIIADPVKRVRQLLSHDCCSARYFKRGGLFAVVEDGVVVTIHRGENSSLWKRKIIN